jgi:hypothetical protein
VVSNIEDKAWIGVDLDGTLAFYDGWTKWNQFGPPIGPMVMRVRGWIAAGRQVRILTARVTIFNPKTDRLQLNVCHKSGEKFSNRDMITAIQDYCEEHVGKRLFVTCCKDLWMTELWDDRAVQVIPNTGRTLAEEHAAQLSAQSGKVYEP